MWISSTTQTSMKGKPMETRIQSIRYLDNVKRLIIWRNWIIK